MRERWLHFRRTALCPLRLHQHSWLVRVCGDIGDGFLGYLWVLRCPVCYHEVPV